MSLSRSLNRIFINSEGELRSGWRALAFVLCLLVITLVIGSAVGLIGILVPSVDRALSSGTSTDGHNSYVVTGNLISAAIALSSASISTAACARLLERRGFLSVGFSLHKGWKRDFAFGSVIGTATLAVAVALESAARAASFMRSSNAASTMAFDFAILFVFFLIAAAYEELVFRGFAFQALLQGLGPLGAVLTAATLFGLGHLLNPHVTVLSTANTVLAGVWLSLAYIKTRSLWLATSLHCFWNLVMVFAFGLPVSGITTFDAMAILSGRSQGPFWISGGSYGPEGGIAVTLALILSSCFLWRSRLLRPSEQMLEALQHGKREPRFISIVDSRD